MKKSLKYQTNRFEASGRVYRAETRLTVYRSSYMRVRWCLAFLLPPRFLVTIDKSCIVRPVIMIILNESVLSRFKIVLKYLGFTEYEPKMTVKRPSAYPSSRDTCNLVFVENVSFFL